MTQQSRRDYDKKARSILRQRGWLYMQTIQHPFGRLSATRQDGLAL
jgi:hypothetical protein